MVVLGRRVGGSIKDWVLGTPEGRLLEACVRPVLVVKQTVEGPYRRVLTGLDFTPTSDAAALLAAALAPAADLHFTHVFQSRQSDALLQTDVPTAILRDVREGEEVGVVARMRRRVAAIGLDSRESRFAVARGSGTPMILNQEQTQGADVVAVGRQQRAKRLDALLGSVSRRVLAHSRGDVLVDHRGGPDQHASAHLADRHRPLTLQTHWSRSPMNSDPAAVQSTTSKPVVALFE